MKKVQPCGWRVSEGPSSRRVRGRKDKLWSTRRTANRNISWKQSTWMESHCVFTIIQSNVRYVSPVLSPLWEITFPTISRPPTHIIRSAPHSYMTAYLLAASGCDRCGPCATYQLIWLICAMIACGRLFTMLQLQGREGQGTQS